MIAAIAIATSLGALRAQDRDPANPNPLTETERIRHLLSRFAFGPTPDLVERVREIGMDAWFEQQLTGAVQESQTLQARLASFESLELDATKLFREFLAPIPRDATAKQRAEASRRRGVPPSEVRDAVLYRAIYSEHQLLETASDFFRNHFNVDIGKGNVRYLVPDYEREVIRAGALGSFATILDASAKHPAMLIYLDNALSRRPLTKAELRTIEINTRVKTGSRERGEESIEIARQRGLNENYARELLELHTLGVDNYYSQRDVIEVAKTLTGWTVQLNPSKPVGFEFRADMHVRGDKAFLGSVIRSDNNNPVSEGEAVLRRLARHDGTARFLAFKLCRFFVDDAPSDALVKRIARAFRQSRGDLPEVYRAIYQDREFFDPAHFQAKFKRPFEFVVSALRATGAEVTSTAALHRVLEQLSEPIYECEDPTGYYDQAEAWRDPGVMAVRWRFATDLANGRIRGARIPRSFYDGLHPRIPKVWKDQLARRILPAGISRHTRSVLDEIVREYLAEHEDPRPERLGAQIVGLLLGSPEFQRQ